jgi:hypothetical protein
VLHAENLSAFVCSSVFEQSDAVCDGAVVRARGDVQHCGNVLSVLLPKLGVCVVAIVPSIRLFSLMKTSLRFYATKSSSLIQQAKM